MYKCEYLKMKFYIYNFFNAWKCHFPRTPFLNFELYTLFFLSMFNLFYTVKNIVCLNEYKKLKIQFLSKIWNFFSREKQLETKLLFGYGPNCKANFSNLENFCKVIQEKFFSSESSSSRPSPSASNPPSSKAELKNFGLKVRHFKVLKKYLKVWFITSLNLSNRLG